MEGGRAPGPAAVVRGELGAARHISPGCRHPPEPRGAGAGCRGWGAAGLPSIQQPVRQVGPELSPRLPRRRLRPRLPPPGPRLLGRGALGGSCGGPRPPAPLFLQRLHLALQHGVGAAGGLGALKQGRAAAAALDVLLGGPRQAPRLSGRAPLHKSCRDKTQGMTPALPAACPAPTLVPPQRASPRLPWGANARNATGECLGRKGTGR